eukprot:4645343-Pyramimonas_sp.AAC.1
MSRRSVGNSEPHNLSRARQSWGLRSNVQQNVLDTEPRRHAAATTHGTCAPTLGRNGPVLSLGTPAEARAPGTCDRTPEALQNGVTEAPQ